MEDHDGTEMGGVDKDKSRFVRGVNGSNHGLEISVRLNRSKRVVECEVNVGDGG